MQVQLLHCPQHFERPLTRRVELLDILNRVGVPREAETGQHSWVMTQKVQLSDTKLVFVNIYNNTIDRKALKKL